MTQATTAPTPPPQQRDRGVFVGTMIAIAALLFVSTAGVLYYRWTAMREPSCVLVVETAPNLRGAEITVDGIMLPQAHKVTIGDNDRYSIVFYLDPGTYSVKVMLAGESQFEGELVLEHPNEGKKIDLKRIRTTTAPVAPTPPTS